MAVNKVVYGTTVLVDLTEDTVTADKLLLGYTAHDKSGALITGTNTGGGSNDFIVTLSYNDTTQMWEPDCTFAEVQAAYDAGKKLAVVCDGLSSDASADGEYSTEREYLVGITYWVRQYESDGGYNALREYGYLFYSEGLTENDKYKYIEPSGNIEITANGTGIDVSHYATANVNVSSSAPSLQSKSVSYTPSETAQSATVTADSGYDGLSQVDVSVGAISSTYIGSGITQRSSTDLTASGATVTVPAGYYSAQASKAVASGTAGTPTATKGAVSNHSVSVTPSVTNTTGYITGGTKTGTAVTVSASELVSGSETKTANGTYDVTNLASLVVNIPFVTYHTSTSAPTSSQGSNGDIWLVTE